MSKSAPQVMVATAGSTGSFDVTTLAGQPLSLQTAEEQRLYRSAQSKYVTQFSFTVASDLRALDRLIFFEILLFRWQAQLASGRDYDGNFLGPAGEDALRRNIKGGRRPKRLGWAHHARGPRTERSAKSSLQSSRQLRGAPLLAYQRDRHGSG